MALSQRYVEKDHYTEDEYLRREEASPFRSEYVRGEIRAVPEATANHSLVMVGVGSELHTALRGRNCRVLSCQMKVWTPDGTIRYPDVTVIQDASDYHGSGRVVITNPIVIVEVLARSTAAIDRGEKWREYQKMNSVEAYLLVAQGAPRVEQYARLENGHWDYHVVEGQKNTLSIPALSVTLNLAEIYEGIEFDPNAEEPS